MTANSRTVRKWTIQFVALALIAILLSGIGWWIYTIILDFRPYWTTISAFILGYLTHHVVVNKLPSITLSAKVRKVFKPMILAIYGVLSALFAFGLALLARDLIVSYLTPILWVVGVFTTWLIIAWSSRGWSHKRP